MKDIETLRRIVRNNMDAWTRISKHGPCWPIARALANAGLGRVEFCLTYCKTDKQWFGHYVVRRPDRKIFDCSGEYVCQECPERVPRYKDFHVFDEPMHDAYTAAQVAFWRRRLL